VSENDIIREVNMTDDPKKLIDLYEKHKAKPRIVKEIVYNKYCPDEIKKDYIEYNLDTKLPYYKEFLGEAGWEENLAALRKSLQSWRPVKTTTPLIKIDSDDKEIMKLLKIIERRKQIIFYGPPGTSKTYLAKGIANLLTHGDENRIETVQFHPSYSYEDFVEGIFPVVRDNGNIEYKVKDKIFKVFCKKAESFINKHFVLIIDEINRADISRVFGELLSCLEYRKQPVTLLYSTEKFIIPENVIIIGTMNTMDRSTIDIDYALRRRFYFYNVKPDVKRLVDILKQNGAEDFTISKVVDIFNNIQKVFPIGHAYFKDVKEEGDLTELWEHQLEPMLEEYFGEFEKEKFNKIKDCFIKEEST